MTTAPARRTLLLLACLFAGCRSPFGKIERDNAGTHLDQAEADLAAGRSALALERLEEVHQVTDLAPDLRAREDRLVNAAAEARFAEIAAGDDPAEDFEDLFRSHLPERVRAAAGMRAAEALLLAESRIRAFRMVKKVDEALPSHHERAQGGDLVARAGLSLVRDPRRYNLLFHYRERGKQALEYLVLAYPLEPRVAEAYYELSRAYEEDRALDDAVQRTEDLLLYHPDSPYAAAAAARLPYLRLLRLGRDDYDRSELLRAEGELAAWLTRYPGHELEGWASELLAECRARLVRSDLYLARFYERTATPAGVRLHAERARALAREQGLVEELAGAEALLEATPAESP
jgi:tetratricopeptide (TPR) repeat protein